MPRQLTLTSEHGVKTDALVIRRNEDGTWEKDWDCLRQDEDSSDVVDVIPVVSYDSFEHALSGWHQPMLNELGRTPEGCFAKINSERVRCRYRDSCAFHDPSVCSGAENPPACFSGGGATGAISEKLDVIFDVWRRGARVCVVDFDRFEEIE